VSNPPYVAENDPALATSVAKYEPKLAAIAGPTGLEALEHIVNHAPSFLIAGGRLLLEHGWQQGEAVRNLLVRQGYSHVRSRTDLAGHERITEGVQSEQTTKRLGVGR
jgi:release factor glutamine methyltransferase